MREEFRAAGHECDALFADDLGIRPAGRQIRQLVAPVLGLSAIARALAERRYDVVDAASAEGLWAAAGKRLGRRRSTAIICRSNGLEHRNYNRMLDDSREGLTSKPWTRRIWYPASRLTQVAAAARTADRLLVLTEGDRRFALDRGWQSADRIDVIATRSLGPISLDRPPGRPAGIRGAVLRFVGPDEGDHLPRRRIQQPRRSRSAGPADDSRPRRAGGDRDGRLQRVGASTRESYGSRRRGTGNRGVQTPRPAGIPVDVQGFGLVVLEAMSQGLPVVAAPAGCAPDLVHEGETGVIVPFRDSHALASAVTRLMSSPDERARLGANCAARVSGMSWKLTAERTVEVYAKALASGASEART